MIDRDPRSTRRLIPTNDRTPPPRAAAIGAVFLLVAAAACSAAPQASPPNQFAADPLWDDGQAEVNAYDATEKRYGIDRPFTAYHIVVKEDFSRRQLVKADPGHDPADLVAVLKLNQIIRLQTGIYSYNQMASTFHERDSMQLLKFSLASFEWCGNTYKEYTRRGREAALHVRTYWDDQADATYSLPVGPDLILYDELPLWVRSLPQSPGTRRELQIVPGQIHSRGSEPTLFDARLEAGSEKSISTPAGRFDALPWTLTSADRTPDVYWVGRDDPHLLLGWDRSDGGSYRLKWTQRLAYWKLSRPGDERYLLGPAAEEAAAR